MLPIHLKIKVKNERILAVQLEAGSGFSIEGSSSKNLLTSIEAFLKNGNRACLSALDWEGITPFTKKVLEAILKIPSGKTQTYSEIARAIGHPKAYRAVGSACGRNPFPFLVPCHRAVGINGLGGFSQGLEIKKALLNYETGKKLF